MSVAVQAALSGTCARGEPKTMPAPQWALLARRRFLPLFATQFLGAFNDNLYRSAMLFLAAFTLYRGAPDRAALSARLIADASRDGVPSHGLNLFPRLLTMIRAGLVDGWFVCEIGDRGPGLDDPLAGYVPPTPGQPGGEGLWISRRLVSRVELIPAEPGLTVRLWL